MSSGWSRCRRLVVFVAVVLAVSGAARVCAASPRQSTEEQPVWSAVWAWVEGLLGREWPWATEKEGVGIDPWGAPTPTSPFPEFDDAGSEINPHG